MALLQITLEKYFCRESISKIIRIFLGPTGMNGLIFTHITTSVHLLHNHFYK